MNSNSERKFSLPDFGACADTGALCTSAFQAAIDECFLSGGGVVEVPRGEYIIGDIRLRSNVTLHLLSGATLVGSECPDDYFNIYNDKLEPLPADQLTRLRWLPPAERERLGIKDKKHLYTAGSYWNYGMIRAVYAENVAIIGEEGSRICGKNLYDPNGEEGYRGPHGINMHFCRNLRFFGYTVVDCGNWAHAIFNSQNVGFYGITVLGGHDALHTRACDGVEISDCRLVTGDDCIAGFNNNDVVIKNCELSSSCSAFRYGGNNILIENCRAYGPCEYQFRGWFTDEEKRSGAQKSAVARNNMLCFFTVFVTDDLPSVRPSGGIVVRNCSVDGADRFMHLNLSGNEQWQRGDPPTDITFEGITATNVKTGLYAYGGGEVDFRLCLRDFSYSARKGSEREPFLRAAHFEKIELADVKIEAEPEAVVKCWTEGGELEVSGLCYGGDGALRLLANEPFECSPI